MRKKVKFLYLQHNGVLTVQPVSGRGAEIEKLARRMNQADRTAGCKFLALTNVQYKAVMR